MFLNYSNASFSFRLHRSDSDAGVLRVPLFLREHKVALVDVMGFAVPRRPLRWGDDVPHEIPHLIVGSIPHRGRYRRPQ